MIRVPRLNLLSSPEVRQPGKAPNYSVNWTTSLSDFENQNTKDLKEDNQLEIVDAMKGKEQVEKILKWKTLSPVELVSKSVYPKFMEDEK